MKNDIKKVIQTEGKFLIGFSIKKILDKLYDNIENFNFGYSVKINKKKREIILKIKKLDKIEQNGN